MFRAPQSATHISEQVQLSSYNTEEEVLQGQLDDRTAVPVNKHSASSGVLAETGQTDCSLSASQLIACLQAQSTGGLLMQLMTK